MIEAPSKSFNAGGRNKDTQQQILREFFLSNTTSRRKAGTDCVIYVPTVCRRVSGKFVEFLGAKF